MAENRYCDIEAFLDTIPQYAGESGVVRAGALLEELGHPEKTFKKSFMLQAATEKVQCVPI